MHLTSSMEDYLKTIFILYRKQGYARCVDISEYMGVTMPSVSRAVKELIKAEYLMKEVNGTLSLTIAGEKVVENVYERHSEGEKGTGIMKWRKDNGTCSLTSQQIMRYE